MGFTDEEKKQILKNYGVDVVEGIVFDYEPPESENVFITKDEWDEKSNEGFKEYYWNEDYNIMQDLEDAFDSLYEKVIDDMNMSLIDEDDADKVIRDKYLGV